MERMIEVEAGRCLNFKASAFSPIAYNRLFPGHDFLRDMDSLKEAHGEGDMSNETFNMSDYELFVRIAYTFAYQGLAPSPRATEEQKEFREKYPDPWTWIDTFNTFSIYEILPEIMDMWYRNEKQISKPKKPVPAPPAK